MREISERTQLSMAMAVLLLALSTMISGCFSRIVIVPPGDPVIIRETVKNWPVWAYGKDGELVKGRADLHAGKHVWKYERPQK